ncbi:MAG: gamma-glutamyltransferase, partial [Longimicrobiales bacterium]
GADPFYRGEIADRIAGHIQDTGGILTRADLAAYEPEVREALIADVDGWKVWTNPPPAIGGAVLVAMLLLMNGRPREAWSEEELSRLVRVQAAVLGFRARELNPSEDLMRDVPRLLEEGTLRELRRVAESGSTIHTSAVDSEGRACSISASTGYGSGVVPPGTGIFLNNCLGEKELNPRGLPSWPVGARLPSNMAPTVARGPDGSVLAVGSPGAGRITTALLQTLLNYLRLDMKLDQAMAHPRLHVEMEEDGRSYRVAHEPGVAVEGLDAETRPFDEISMFFGGVTAALWRPGYGFQVAADPRRVGGVAVHLAD